MHFLFASLSLCEKCSFLCGECFIIYIFISLQERERESMLERFKSLSEGVNVLETSNHTLEAETSEAR